MHLQHKISLHMIESHAQAWQPSHDPVCDQIDDQYRLTLGSTLPTPGATRRDEWTVAEPLPAFVRDYTTQFAPGQDRCRCVDGGVLVPALSSQMIVTRRGIRDREDINDESMCACGCESLKPATASE